ncbi:hypothetical protein AIOL_002084 [Candidatus Rhodobacter oscarellae]|uniref:DUF2059 domain-containing protein n=1 Tax=Candidatus Rhodobacter oscarellae TaxID=1675527 RepID=A0A0J9E5R5_9RHOB|nr:DUF2059 domain-containing protein [Candidatus Rhodobacter lobularis]KMW57124.1 hypothetical protein AIOL_002084 [Candidatus Rhodobacter lobularis]
MLRFLAAAALSVLSVLAPLTAARAQSVAPIDTLYRALGLPEIVEIMREEGLGHGADMRADLLGGAGGARWDALVSAIYDADRMADTLRSRMDIVLAAEDLAPMIAFFTSDLGQEIIALEVSARRAFLEPDIEQASKDAVARMAADQDARLTLIEALTDKADLIDSNVVGALNSNFAFYTGLAEGGGLPGALTEEEILADVWSQEPDIRSDTTEWLLSYLTLAYAPLSDAELNAYIAFFETDAGVALNEAIFAAFDEMFVDISRALGQAAAGFMVGEEL